MARLLDLLRETRAARAATRQLALGVHRSDYMLDTPSQGFLQARGGRGARKRLR